MIKTVFVTGGNGFIGSHLISKLLENEIKVFACVRKDSDLSRLTRLIKHIDLIELGNDDLDEVFSLKKIDCVIHLATKYIKNHSSAVDVAKMINSNIQFPSEICELCLKHGVKYFINTGTFFEYQQNGEAIQESELTSPYNFYAATKVSFLDILKFYSKYGLSVIDLKLFAPYGEHDNDKLINLLMKTIIKGEYLEFSGGMQRWNFTYVEDIVNAYILSLKKIEKMIGLESFNIGSGESYSIREIVNHLEKISNKKANILWGKKKYMPNEIMNVSCDYSKAKKMLGWIPKTSITDGLKSTYNYYLEHIYGKQ